MISRAECADDFDAHRARGNVHRGGVPPSFRVLFLFARREGFGQQVAKVCGGGFEKDGREEPLVTKKMGHNKEIQ